MFRLIPLVILLLSVTVFSQNIKVRSAGNGKARISSGKLQSIINLSKDVSGCFMTYDGTDPKRKKYDVTDFDLMDSVKKGNSIYVVLLGTAGGNCNVQGRCGATEDWSVVWLKLDNRLKVIKKQTAIVQSCYYSGIELESEIDEAKTPFKMVNGAFKIEYSENLYNQDLDYKYYILTYQRAEAEKGFSITTEKRERPKN